MLRRAGCASAGVGTGAHLTGELFRISLGLDRRDRPRRRVAGRGGAAPKPLREGERGRGGALGFEPSTATADEVAALIKGELPKWAGVIRAAGIKPN